MGPVSSVPTCGIEAIDTWQYVVDEKARKKQKRAVEDIKDELGKGQLLIENPTKEILPMAFY